MVARHDEIERGIPDLIATDRLPAVAAAEVDFLAGRCGNWLDLGGPMVRARARVCLGREAEAIDLIERSIGDTRDPQEIVAGAWAVSRVGPRRAAEDLLAALDRSAPFLFESDVPLGPSALAQGPLLAAMGDLDSAEARLNEAVEQGDRRAPVWGARARIELARIKMSRRAAGDLDAGLSADIDHLLSSATLFFRAGGYHFMQTMTDELAATTEVPTLGAPNVGRLRPGRPWQVGFGVAADVAMRPAKGLTALRHLVENPGRPVPAVELDQLVNGGDVTLLDELRGRLADRDPEVSSDEYFSAEIRSALFDEKTRSRVGKLLARSIRRVTDEHPLLGSHLSAHVRAGHLCRYDPSDVDPVIWKT